MAIGFYLLGGSNNHILNCDAYNNYDSVSEGGKGGNVDGFGGHINSSSVGEGKGTGSCVCKDVAHGTIVMMVSI